MEQPIATVHPYFSLLSPGLSPGLSHDFDLRSRTGRVPHHPSPGMEPIALAALARQGSAAAHDALVRCCTEGPLLRRIAALRLLPGLPPFQPVWPILDQVSHPSEPAPVQETVAQVRTLLCD